MVKVVEAAGTAWDVSSPPKAEISHAMIKNVVIKIIVVNKNDCVVSHLGRGSRRFCTQMLQGFSSRIV